MRVLAVVVNHDAAPHLAGCLESLLAQDHPDIEIVVVDNASTDGSGSVLARYEHRLTVVRNRTNRGYAGAINDAVAGRHADAVLVCNPDVVAAPDHVRWLVDALAADPRRGSVQGKLVRPDGSVDSTGHVAFRARLFHNRGEGKADDGRHDRPGAVFGVTGAIALHRRPMLDDVAIEVAGRDRPEIFDEDLFAYFEDVDLDWRAAMRGWVAWYEPRAVATHLRRGARANRSAWVEALNWSNRLLVLVKCDHPGALLRALPGLAATTLIKSGALAIRDPVALVRGVGRFLRLLPVMLAKRREVQRRASVPSAALIEAWFGDLSYRDWVGAFRRRQRR